MTCFFTKPFSLYFARTCLSLAAPQWRCRDYKCYFSCSDTTDRLISCYDPCLYSYALQPSKTQHVMNLLSHRGGLEGHRCLLCPETHRKKSMSFYFKNAAWCRVLPTKTPANHCGISVSTLGPGFPVGPLAPRAPRGPCRETNKHMSQTQKHQVVSVSKTVCLYMTLSFQSVEIMEGAERTVGPLCPLGPGLPATPF